MAKITITIWDETDDLAVVAADFDPPVKAEGEGDITQAQKIGLLALEVLQDDDALPGSKTDGVWTDKEGWIDEPSY